MKLSILILSTTLFCLSACGFTLRGTTPLPTAMNTIRIQPNEPYNPLHREVAEQLALTNAHVTTSATGDSVTLTLKDEKVSRQTTVIGTDGEIKQQILTYSFTYHVKSKDGKKLIPDRTVHASRVLYIQPAQILSQDNEERVLTNTMRSETVQQLMRQLANYKPTTKPILPVTP